MKRKLFGNIRPIALAAIGVILGRGAQADTTLDFEFPVPPGQSNLDPIKQFFGDNASASSAGVTVSGFGTPNIGLTWGGTGLNDTRWDYYNDGGSVWTAAQLNGSYAGSAHTLKFTPNSAAARVQIKSFNFHPYYLFSAYGEVFSYNVSILSGTNVVYGPTNYTFQSNGDKDHPVAINYTGGVGQTLKLKLERLTTVLDTNTSPAETFGGPGDIAVDDIVFAQLPASLQSVGPQVVFTSPRDEQSGVLPFYSYTTTITNATTTVVPGTVQLRLNGVLVSPAPTVTTVGILNNVSYSAPGIIPTNPSHVYTLTYQDNLGANYTNITAFSVIYVTLPSAYAVPTNTAAVRGFRHRNVSASLETGPINANTLVNTIARAKAQLAGTLINPNTAQPYTNSAPVGPNADGSFNVNTVCNFSDELNGPGNFTNDVTFPGLPAGVGITNQSFATDSYFYLNLTPNFYRFGVRSDDGFEVSVTPPAGVPGSDIVVGLYDDGRGAGDPDVLFDFVVTTGGLYRFRLIYFEGWGDASCEFLSITNLTTGAKTLINDSSANSINSYRVIAPQITSIVKSGANATVNWLYGTPPYQVQAKTNLTDAAWSNVGSSTSTNTAVVPAASSTKFIRIGGS